MFPQYEFIQTPKSNYSYGYEAPLWGVARTLDKIAVHWWGCACDENNHQAVINTFLNPTRGASSHFVLSNTRVTQMIPIDDIAWATNRCNPSSIAIEFQPNLGNSGYAKGGKLIYEIEQRVGRQLELIPHNACNSTQCPGSISLDKLRQEADAYKAYVEAPVVPEWKANLSTVSQTVKYANQVQIQLYNLENMSVIKMFNLDTKFDIAGQTTVNGVKYYLTVYSMTNNQPNGIRADQLKDTITPPAPVVPEWKANLVRFTTTKYWFTKGEKLRDLCNGGAETSEKTFAKNEMFIAVARTRVSGVEYVLTDYSVTKDRCRGVPTSSLSLTDPTIIITPPVSLDPHVHDIPATAPVQVTVTRDEANWFISSLMTIINKIRKAFGL